MTGESCNEGLPQEPMQLDRQTPWLTSEYDAVHGRPDVLSMHRSLRQRVQEEIGENAYVEEGNLGFGPDGGGMPYVTVEQKNVDKIKMILGEEALVFPLCKGIVMHVRMMLEAQFPQMYYLVQSCKEKGGAEGEQTIVAVQGEYLEQVRGVLDLGVPVRALTKEEYCDIAGQKQTGSIVQAA